MFYELFAMFVWLKIGMMSETLSRIIILLVLLLFDTEKSNRDSIGGSAVVGDRRWAGTFGVEADFVARTHCSVAIIPINAIKVSSLPTLSFFLESCSIWLLQNMYKI